MSDKSLWRILGLVMLLLAVVFFSAKAVKIFLSKRKLNSALNQIPQNLVLATNNQDISLFRPVSEPDLKLRVNETLAEEGIAYTDNREQKEVLKDIFNEITAKKWMFTGGTQEIADGMVFKISVGGRYYFVKVTGGTQPMADKTYQTLVNIIPVNKK